MRVLEIRGSSCLGVVWRDGARSTPTANVEASAETVGDDDVVAPFMDVG